MQAKFIKTKLDKRREGELYRALQTPGTGIDFSSNDYLGLSNSPDLENFINNSLKETTLPHGSTGSRLLTGNHSFFEKAEQFLTTFFQGEDTLLFNSGYTANLALLSSIAGKNDTFLIDEKAHASIKDGVRLSQAKHFSFRHNSAESLEKKALKSSGNIFVVIESVYSMDGTSADLKNIVEVCIKHGLFLIVDEAHSTGINGRYGEGFVLEQSLDQHVFARIHTFGKAIGSHGACIVGSRELKEYIINFSRPFIYTTAMPPSQVFRIIKTLEFLKKNTSIIDTLKNNISYFTKLGNDIPERFFQKTSSPIQAFLFSGNKNVKTLANQLKSEGFDTFPILYPTVSEGAERIRICIHAFNTHLEMQQLTNTFSCYLNKSL
ncbi:MAG: pyridoxal phosphate-dependent aminotransferase family protein [Cyclobacteriaceae bacterium]|nr:pyridoxal phosphate-dependent aminotransferase family protein [Cyclobacteriaceae bacterium]